MYVMKYDHICPYFFLHLYPQLHKLLIFKIKELHKSN